MASEAVVPEVVSLDHESSIKAEDEDDGVEALMPAPAAAPSPSLAAEAAAPVSKKPYVGASWLLSSMEGDMGSAELIALAKALQPNGAVRTIADTRLEKLFAVTAAQLADATARALASQAARFEIRLVDQRTALEADLNAKLAAVESKLQSQLDLTRKGIETLEFNLSGVERDAQARADQLELEVADRERRAKAAADAARAETLKHLEMTRIDALSAAEVARNEALKAREDALSELDKARARDREARELEKRAVEASQVKTAELIATIQSHEEDLEEKLEEERVARERNAEETGAELARFEEEVKQQESADRERIAALEKSVGSTQAGRTTVGFGGEDVARLRAEIKAVEQAEVERLEVLEAMEHAQDEELAGMRRTLESESRSLDQRTQAETDLAARVEGAERESAEKLGRLKSELEAKLDAVSKKRTKAPPKGGGPTRTRQQVEEEEDEEEREKQEPSETAPPRRTTERKRKRTCAYIMVSGLRAECALLAADRLRADYFRRSTTVTIREDGAWDTAYALLEYGSEAKALQDANDLDLALKRAEDRAEQDDDWAADADAAAASAATTTAATTTTREKHEDLEGPPPGATSGPEPAPMTTLLGALDIDDWEGVSVRVIDSSIASGAAVLVVGDLPRLPMRDRSRIESQLASSLDGYRVVGLGKRTEHWGFTLLRTESAEAALGLTSDFEGQPVMSMFGALAPTTVMPAESPNKTKEATSSSTTTTTTTTVDSLADDGEFQMTMEDVGRTIACFPLSRSEAAILTKEVRKLQQQAEAQPESNNNSNNNNNNNNNNKRPNGGAHTVLVAGLATAVRRCADFGALDGAERAALDEALTRLRAAAAARGARVLGEPRWVLAQAGVAAITIEPAAGDDGWALVDDDDDHHHHHQHDSAVDEQASLQSALTPFSPDKSQCSFDDDQTTASFVQLESYNDSVLSRFSSKRSHLRHQLSSLNRMASMSNMTKVKVPDASQSLNGRLEEVERQVSRLQHQLTKGGHPYHHPKSTGGGGLTLDDAIAESPPQESTARPKNDDDDDDGRATTGGVAAAAAAAAASARRSRRRSSTGKEEGEEGREAPLFFFENAKADAAAALEAARADVEASMEARARDLAKRVDVAVAAARDAVDAKLADADARLLKAEAAAKAATKGVRSIQTVYGDEAFCDNLKDFFQSSALAAPPSSHHQKKNAATTQQGAGAAGPSSSSLETGGAALETLAALGILKKNRATIQGLKATFEVADAIAKVIESSREEDGDGVVVPGHVAALVVREVEAVRVETAAALATKVSTTDHARDVEAALARAAEAAKEAGASAVAAAEPRILAQAEKTARALDDTWAARATDLQDRVLKLASTVEERGLKLDEVDGHIPTLVGEQRRREREIWDFVANREEGVAMRFAKIGNYVSSRMQKMQRHEDRLERVAATVQDRPTEAQVRAMLQRLEASIRVQCGDGAALSLLVERAMLDLKKKLSQLDVQRMIDASISAAEPRLAQIATLAGAQRARMERVRRTDAMLTVRPKSADALRKEARETVERLIHDAQRHEETNNFPSTRPRSRPATADNNNNNNNNNNNDLLQQRHHHQGPKSPEEGADDGDAERVLLPTEEEELRATAAQWAANAATEAILRMPHSAMRVEVHHRTRQGTRPLDPPLRMGTPLNKMTFDSPPSKVVTASYPNGRTGALRTMGHAPLKITHHSNRPQGNPGAALQTTKILPSQAKKTLLKVPKAGAEEAVVAASRTNHINKYTASLGKIIREPSTDSAPSLTLSISSAPALLPRVDALNETATHAYHNHDAASHVSLGTNESTSHNDPDANKRNAAGGRGGS